MRRGDFLLQIEAAFLGGLMAVGPLLWLGGKLRVLLGW